MVPLRVLPRSFCARGKSDFLPVPIGGQRFEAAWSGQAPSSFSSENAVWGEGLLAGVGRGWNPAVRVLPGPLVWLPSRPAPAPEALPARPPRPCLCDPPCLRSHPAEAAVNASRQWVL